MNTIHIPTPLRSYTNGHAVVAAEGATLAALFADLDRRYPGIRFRFVDEQDRIRDHVKVFVNKETAADLAFPIAPNDSLRIVMAISGG